MWQDRRTDIIPTYALRAAAVKKHLTWFLGQEHREEHKGQSINFIAVLLWRSMPGIGRLTLVRDFYLQMSLILRNLKQPGICRRQMRITLMISILSKSSKVRRQREIVVVNMFYFIFQSSCTTFIYIFSGNFGNLFPMAISMHGDSDSYMKNFLNHYNL